MEGGSWTKKRQKSEHYVRKSVLLVVLAAIVQHIDKFSSCQFEMVYLFKPGERNICKKKAISTVRYVLPHYKHLYNCHYKEHKSRYFTFANGVILSVTHYYKHGKGIKFMTSLCMLFYIISIAIQDCLLYDNIFFFFKNI